MAVTNLRKRANRNVWISLLMLLVLIGTVLFAAKKVNDNFASLKGIYAEQIELERFRASLTSVLAPLNDFSLTGNTADADRLDERSAEFNRLFKKLSASPNLTPDETKELREVSELLMGEVISMGANVVSGKIPAEQAKNVTVVAQNLVFVAQKKVDLVARGLNGRLDGLVESKQNH